MQRLPTFLIVLLPLVPEAVLLNMSPSLIDALRSGDIAAGLVLTVAGLCCLYVATIQLALCLAGLARIAGALHLPGATTLGRAAYVLSPRIARITLAGALGTGLGTAALPAQAVEQTVSAATAAPSADSPGWPTSRTDPSWPTTAAPAHTEDTATSAAGQPQKGPITESPPQRGTTKKAQSTRPDTRRASTSTAAGKASAGATVTVVRGDSLWSIARAQLSARGTEHPTMARMAKHVDDLYAHNKGRIGPNPNLIMPGLRLEMP